MFISGHIRIENAAFGERPVWDGSWKNTSPENLALPANERQLYAIETKPGISIARVTGKSNAEVVFAALQETLWSGKIKVKKLTGAPERRNRTGRHPHVLAGDESHVWCWNCMAMQTESAARYVRSDFTTDCPLDDIDSGLRMLIRMDILDFVDGVWIRKHGPIQV